MHRTQLGWWRKVCRGPPGARRHNCAVPSRLAVAILPPGPKAETLNLGSVFQDRPDWMPRSCFPDTGGPVFAARQNEPAVRAAAHREYRGLVFEEHLALQTGCRIPKADAVILQVSRRHRLTVGAVGGTVNDGVTHHGAKRLSGGGVPLLQVPALSPRQDGLRIRTKRHGKDNTATGGQGGTRFFSRGSSPRDCALPS